MAIISRQTGLLSAENWKKVYQTFREADFTAYDFETLRKSMIDYIKLNYAEDYNDFTESSEFIALIDLIAFLGQSLAFRTDLNARENFMDTAERRDSILKLARMISYNPKRAISASGFLKIDSVSTTEIVYDSDGVNLSNTQVNWDDSTNENWLEQFSSVINAALQSGQVFGKPGASKTIGAVRHDEYSVNVVPNIVPVYRFSAAIEGQDMSFEVVSASTYDKSYVYESAPDIAKPFNILYRHDGNGNSSNDTGFFFYFKQGELNQLDFVIDEMLPNKVVNVDVNNINNSDVWLYSVDTDSTTKDQWQQVPATSGINVIYNTRTERNLFQVNSRINDQISFVFGDGSFANIPQGNFRTFYRVSNGLTYKITPDELRGVTISFDYVSRYNRVETITFRASLRYTVANARSRESIDEIKQRAPQQYYTQNRMVTGEDYNILPYTNYSNVSKVKAINRTSSGLSRYLDVLDTTGKYSSTNIFAEDGVLYSERSTSLLSFTFNTAADIRRVFRNQVIPDIVAGKEIMHYYYATVLEERPIDNEIAPSKMRDGEVYTIIQSGDTDFTKYGAGTSQTGEVFVASNAGTRTRNYTIVNNGTASWTFTSDLNAVNPTLTIRVGDVLKLSVNANGHPLWIKTAATTGTTNPVTTGTITGNGVQVGTVTWDTTGVAPGNYFYICQNHSAMAGLIVVEGFGTGKVRAGLKWNLSTVNDSSVTGYFTYNGSPSAIAVTAGNRSKFMRPGAMLRCVAPIGYYFNSMLNLIKGQPSRDTDTRVVYAAITQVIGDGTNSGVGNFDNGVGPVKLNLKIPTGAIIESVIPVFQNSLSDTVVNQAILHIESFSNFGLYYDTQTQAWQVLSPSVIPNNNKWWIKFEYSNVSNIYNIYYKGVRYVIHSPNDTNFFYDESLKIYDNTTNSVVRDSVKILKTNRDPRFNQALGQDYTWYVYKPIVRNDGSVDKKSIYLTYADTNDDGVPDIPDLFERVTLGTPLNSSSSQLNANYYSVEINRYYKTYLGRYPNQVELDYWVNSVLTGAPLDDVRLSIMDSAEAASYRNGVEINDNIVFFEYSTGYDGYGSLKLLDNHSVISNIVSYNELTPEVLRNFDLGQLIYVQQTESFYRVQLNSSNVKVVSSELNSASPTMPRYRSYVGRQNLYFKYRHNSPNTHRIDPSISNIVDLYILTTDYDTSYRQWVQDSSNKVVEPAAPTNTELQVNYADLENFKSISDTIIFHSAVFKPLFGAKADTALQATFKVVKNPSLNISDADVKTSVIAAINTYFASENWDFGETFYFSELAAYLHKELSPDIASIIIVPKDTSINFGSFYQINAEPHELLISAATVNDVEIISAITAAQLNQNLAIVNQSVSI